MKITEEMKNAMPDLTENNVYRMCYKYMKKTHSCHDLNDITDEEKIADRNVGMLISLFDKDYHWYHLPNEYDLDAYNLIRFEDMSKEMQYMFLNDLDVLVVERGHDKECGEWEYSLLFDDLVDKCEYYYTIEELAFIEELAESVCRPMCDVFGWYNETLEMFGVRSFGFGGYDRINHIFEEYGGTLISAFMTYLSWR